MAQFFLKIAHLSFSMGPTPLLKMVFSYGLRPRLWILPKVEISRHDGFLFLFFVQLDCHLAVYVKIGFSLICFSASLVDRDFNPSVAAFYNSY